MSMATLLYYYTTMREGFVDVRLLQRKQRQTCSSSLTSFGISITWNTLLYTSLHSTTLLHKKGFRQVRQSLPFPESTSSSTFLRQAFEITLSLFCLLSSQIRNIYLLTPTFNLLNNEMQKYIMLKQSLLQAYLDICLIDLLLALPSCTRSKAAFSGPRVAAGNGTPIKVSISLHI